jgi:hypothetical protein
MRDLACADGDPVVVSSNSTVPTLTRRRLLVAGSASGVAAMVALNPALAKAAGAVAGDPAYLRRASYTGLVGQPFLVDWWGSSDTLTLAGVSDLGARDLAGRDDAFSLTFSGAPSLAVGKEPISLSNRSLGRFELFVSRVDPTGASQLFEAVINRSVGANRPKAPRPSSSGNQPAPPTHHPETAVKHVTATRTTHGLRLEIVLRDNSEAKHAHGWLSKGERLVAAFGSTAVHDHRLVVKLPTPGRRLARGGYELVVAAGGQAARLDQVPVELR